MRIGYCLVGFVIFFFMYKKYWPIIQEKMRKDYLANWMDFKEFWIMVLVPTFWLFAIPLYFFWLFLDYIYERYINKNKTGEAENR
jgi:hypothetical protein